MEQHFESQLKKPGRICQDAARYLKGRVDPMETPFKQDDLVVYFVLREGNGPQNLIRMLNTKSLPNFGTAFKFVEQSNTLPVFEKVYSLVV
ncbi:MAG: hypothetical protein ACREAU_04415 [Nitrosopumilaceae archaeon]